MNLIMAQTEQASTSRKRDITSQIQRLSNETLVNLLKTKKWSDLTIILRSKSYRVHRNIICSVIPFFEAMMSSKFRESRKNYVKINHPIEHDAFEWLIEWAYSLKKELNYENVYPLLKASDYLQINEVFQACCAHLDKILDVETALTIKEWIRPFEVGQLANKVTVYITENFKAISKTKEWFNLSAQLVTKYMEDGDAVGYKEKQILFALLEWAKFDPGSRQKNILSLLKLIKWKAIRIMDIIEKVAHHELIKDDENCRNLILEILEFKVFRNFYPASPYDRARIHKYNGEALMAFEKSNDYLISYVMTPFSKVWRDWGIMLTDSSYSDQFQAAVTRDFIYIYLKSDDELSENFLQLYPKCISSYPASQTQCVTSSYDTVYSAVHTNDLQSTLKIKSTKTCESPKWIDVLTISNNLSNFGMIYLNDSLYLIGGCFGDSKSASSVNQRYDLIESRWDILSSMSIPRLNPKLIALQGKIYVFGGTQIEPRSNNQITLHSAEYYDPKQDKWFNMPFPKNGNKIEFLIPFCSKLYAFLDKKLKNVSIYNPETNAWSEKEMPSLKWDVNSVIFVPNVQTL